MLKDSGPLFYGCYPVQQSSYRLLEDSLFVTNKLVYKERHCTHSAI